MVWNSNDEPPGGTRKKKARVRVAVLTAVGVLVLLAAGVPFVSGVVAAMRETGPAPTQSPSAAPSAKVTVTVTPTPEGQQAPTTQAPPPGPSPSRPPAAAPAEPAPTRAAGAPPQKTGNISGTAMFGPALYTAGSTWLSQHGNSLYVVACDPEYSPIGRFTGCSSEVDVKLQQPQPGPVLATAPFRIDGLVRGHPYQVVLFEDANGNGRWDWSDAAEGPLMWPPPSDVADLIRYPDETNIALRYDPVVPPA